MDKSQKHTMRRLVNHFRLLRHALFVQLRIANVPSGRKGLPIACLTGAGKSILNPCQQGPYEASALRRPLQHGCVVLRCGEQPAAGKERAKCIGHLMRGILDDRGRCLHIPERVAPVVERTDHVQSMQLSGNGLDHGTSLDNVWRRQCAQALLYRPVINTHFVDDPRGDEFELLGLDVALCEPRLLQRLR